MSWCYRTILPGFLICRAPLSRKGQGSCEGAVVSSVTGKKLGVTAETLLIAILMELRDQLENI